MGMEFQDESELGEWKEDGGRVGSYGFYFFRKMKKRLKDDRCFIRF